MRIPNPLTLNDWDIKKFLWVVLSIQGLVLLGIGPLAHVAPIRAPISLLYLLFVPGALILRVARVHKIGATKTLLYSVGLSLAVVMFTGLVMNTLLPVFGISRPISTVPLAAVLATGVAFLCPLAWLRDRKFSNTEYVDLKGFISAPVLLLSLLPLMSILGTYLVNFYDSNVILLALIALIALVVLLAGFTKFIPERLYPWAIFTITISLLLHRSLISLYLTGYDIHEEYNVAAAVLASGHWDPTTPSLVNSLLSVTLLPATISDISGLTLTWIFKVIYPALFSLVPVGMYAMFRSQIGNKPAFLACFVFVSAVRMYYDAVMFPRQMVATLFTVSVITLVMDKEISSSFRSILFVVFSAAMVVSHYWLAYSFMLILLSAWLALGLMRRFRAWRTTPSLERAAGPESTAPQADTGSGSGIITPISVAVVTVFAVTWYMLVSQSHVFDVYVFLFEHLIETLTKTPEVAGVSTRVDWFASQTGFDIAHEMVNSALNYLRDLFFVVGAGMVLWQGNRRGFHRSYVALSLLSMAMFAVTVTPPLMSPMMAAGKFDTGRFQFMALVFQAPFHVAGGLFLYAKIVALFARVGNGVEKLKNLGPAAISVFLALLFLLQIGFVKEIAGRNPNSVSIGQNWVEEHGNGDMIARLRSAVTPEQDVFSAKWMADNRADAAYVYAIYGDGNVHTLTSYGMMPKVAIPSLSRGTNSVPDEAYVYLQYVNVVDGIATEYNSATFALTSIGMEQVVPLFAGKSKTYSNGGSEILQ